jgi:hypothetical protein
MKQSAVEFLELMFLRILSFDSEEHRKKYKDVIRQAKEMFEQQIKDAYEDGYSDSDNTFELNKEYYNKQFKNK